MHPRIRTVRLRSSTLAAGLVALASGACAEDPFTAYLFAYFTGNSKSQEAIRFALSDDGFNYKSINNGQPVLSSAAISATGGVRDPHILRGENGDYLMVATDMVSANGWNSNHGMVLLKSANLVDWTASKIDIRTAFPSLAAADRVWAPQTIWDAKAGKYLVYFAMRLGGNDIDKIYGAYANTSFTALETAPKVLYTYNGKAAIDADIVLKDGVYHLFFKTEGTGNGIKTATATALTGPYTLIDRYVQPTTKAVEGSCAFRLTNSDTWVLMYDMYMDGQYQFATSKDLLTFSVASQKWSFDFTPRHGTVIPVTAKEKVALNAKWNPSAISSVVAAPALGARLRNGTHLEWQGGESLSRLALYDAAGSLRGSWSAVGASALLPLPSALPHGVYRLVATNTEGRASRTGTLVAP